MKILTADNNFCLTIGNSLFLVSPFATNLDGRFHRFSPCIHRQHLIEPKHTRYEALVRA